MPVLPAFPPERMQAPRADGAILSRPALVNGLQLARENAEQFQHSELDIAGRSLTEFRRWARLECFQSARRWMAKNLGIEVSVANEDRLANGLLFVTGHQPQLNHAGVWMKNVAAERLADCCGGQGLNLIVDNDLAGPPAVRCPSGTRKEPRFDEIPYDASQPTQPWEELQVQDQSLFSSFSQRVANELQPWGISPILNEVWPAALETLQRTNRMTAVLSACRVAQERHWNIQNLELPVSELCQTPPFLAFVGHLCRHFEQFFEDYNSAVHAYRQKYHVRNHRHPVPDLERRDDYYELPFWYWDAGDHDRARVFVRRMDDQIEIYGGDRFLTRIPANSNDDSSLEELQQTGRFRTRALTTTLFARLCLGALFIHGIGGARYDEITDGIMESLFEISAPKFLTLTATLHLPLRPFDRTDHDVMELKNSLRELRFNGNRQGNDSRIADLYARRDALIAEKRSERATGLSKSERRARRSINRQRHLELKSIQRELSELAAPTIEALEQELNEAREQLRANSILKSREYPACLFSRNQLNQLIVDLRQQICGRR